MSLLIAMISFSLSMSISPGPVNMVTVSSGMNYGIRKTLPFVSGSTIGFTLLLLFIGLGFSQVISKYPNFLNYLTFAGSLFIVYMGYLIATATPELNIKKQKRPTFLQGFLLQWLNPKAWVACLAGASLFSVPNSSREFLLFSLIYFIVCFLSLFSWSLLGDKSSKLLDSRLKLRVFNFTMGCALITTAVYLVYAQLG